MGLNPALWHDFFATIATASAALLGLFIVAISLQLRVVEEHAIIRNQARVSLLLLALTLGFAATGVVPGVSALWLGAEVVVAVVLQLSVYTGGIIRATRSVGIPADVWARSILVVALALLTMGGGVSLLIQNGPGLYLVVPWLIAVPLGAVFMAWRVVLTHERPGVKSRSGPATARSRRSA